MLGNKDVPGKLGDIQATLASNLQSRFFYQGTGVVMDGNYVFGVGQMRYPNYDNDEPNRIVAYDWTNDFEPVGYLGLTDANLGGQAAGMCYDPATQILFLSTSFGTNLIHLYDCSDPTDIQPLGKVSSTNFGGSVSFPDFGDANMAAKNGILIVVCSASSTNPRLKAVDYSNPNAPTTVGSLYHADLVGANAVAFDGSYAYVSAFNTARLVVCNFTTPSSPSRTGSVTHASFSSVNGVSILDSTHIIICHQQGMGIVDHSTKASPTRTGGITGNTANFSAFQNSSRCLDGYAFISGDDIQTFSVNCTSYTSPVVATTYPGTEYLRGGFTQWHLDETNDRFVLGAYQDPNTLSVLSIPSPGNFTLEAYYLNDVALIQDFIWLGNDIFMTVNLGNLGCAFYDVSDPFSPERYFLLSHFSGGSQNPDGPSGRMACKVGNRVYITDDSGGSIWIINVSDLNNPSVVTEWVPGTLNFPAQIKKLTSNHLAITSSNEAKAYIVSIASPDSPSLIATVDTTGVVDNPYLGSDVYGNWFFFNGFEDQFGVLDAATPSSPVLTVFTDTRFTNDGNSFRNLFVHDHYLYTITDNGMYVYNLDPDPADMQYVWAIPFSQGLNSEAPAIIGDRGWSMYWYPPDYLNAVFFLFNMSNDERPYVQGYNWEYPESGYFVKALGEGLLVFENMPIAEYGLWVVEPIGAFDTIGMITETDLAQTMTHKKIKAIAQTTTTNTAQAVSNSPKRRLVNQITTTNTARTIERGFDQIPMTVVSGMTASDISQLEGARGIDTQGIYAYIATQASLGGTNDRLTIMDISDPFNMVYVGSIGDVLLNDIQDLKVSGNYVYAACTTGDRLTVVDVTTPSAPTIAGSVTNVLLDGAFAVAVLDATHVVVAASIADALVVIDVSVPATPTIAGSVVNTQLDGANAVDVYGVYAFVTSLNQDRLTIVNCTTPSSPTISGSISDGTYLDNPQGVVMSHDYAYVTAGPNRLTVVDITNVASPTVAGSVSNALLNTPLGLDILYPYVYVTANGGNDLVAVNISNPVSPTVVDNTASPATPTLNEIWDVSIANGYAFATTNSTSATPSSTGIIAVGLDGPRLLNAVHWWDFSNTASRTGGGGVISSIADLIGAATMTATGGASEINESTAVGTNSLTSGHADPSGGGAPERMYTAGLTVTAQPIGVSWIGKMGTTFTSPGEGVFFNLSSLTPRPHAYTFGTWTMTATSAVTGGASDNLTHIFYAEFNGASSKFYIDGSLAGTGDVGVGAPNVNGTLFNVEGGGIGGDIYIGELVICTGTQASGDITNEYNRLFAKWG